MAKIDNHVLCVMTLAIEDTNPHIFAHERPFQTGALLGSNGVLVRKPCFVIFWFQRWECWITNNDAGSECPCCCMIRAEKKLKVHLNAISQRHDMTKHEKISNYSFRSLPLYMCFDYTVPEDLLAEPMEFSGNFVYHAFSFPASATVRSLSSTVQYIILKYTVELYSTVQYSVVYVYCIVLHIIQQLNIVHIAYNIHILLYIQHLYLLLYMPQQCVLCTVQYRTVQYCVLSKDLHPI